MYKKIDVDCMVISESNKREHWRAAHARHKKQKATIRKSLTVENIPRLMPVKITMIRVGKKKLDSDNLQGAFKYVRDAIADYFIPGLLAGRADDDPGLHWEYSQTKGLPSIQLEFDWIAPQEKTLSHEERLWIGVDKFVPTSLKDLLADTP